MNLTISCKNATVSPNGISKIFVDIEDCDEDFILDEFDELTVINHFDYKRLLDLIGEGACMEYFNLIENQE